MAVMAIMTGIQPSGKSTFCKKYLTEYVRINLDTLHTRNKENMAVDEAFRLGKDMVIDNTNPTVEDRQKYILRAKENGYRVIGYFMQSRQLPISWRFRHMRRALTSCILCGSQIRAWWSKRGGMSLDQILLPETYMVARLDGRSFTRLTKET